MKIFPLILTFITIAVAAQAAGFRTGQSADGILGQADFTTGSIGTISANRFGDCESATVDPTTGKIFAVDTGCSRILRFASAATMNDGEAEAVFGQPDFTTIGRNTGGLSAKTLNQPHDACVDRNGTLWVADQYNQRVLGFFHASSLGNQPAADIVLGQANFTTNTTGAFPNEKKLGLPTSVLVDAHDTLWVGDYQFLRVVRFDFVSDKANGAAADGVLGQADFVSGTVAVTAATMNYPSAISMDRDGGLWVGDIENHRVLYFSGAAGKANGAAADAEIGQPDFTTGTSPQAPNASNFKNIDGLEILPDGELWVADNAYNRVLHFSTPTSPAPTADQVLGQTDFVSGGVGTTASSLSGPRKIHFASDGTMYVADETNHRILRFTPDRPPTPAKPTLKLKGKKKLLTTHAKVVFKGTATNATRVEVKAGHGHFTAVHGTASWSCKARLQSGKNTILIRAVNSAGQFSTPLKITVVRN